MRSCFLGTDFSCRFSCRYPRAVSQLSAAVHWGCLGAADKAGAAFGAPGQCWKCCWVCSQQQHVRVTSVGLRVIIPKRGYQVRLGPWRELEATSHHSPHVRPREITPREKQREKANICIPINWLRFSKLVDSSLCSFCFKHRVEKNRFAFLSPIPFCLIGLL